MRRNLESRIDRLYADPWAYYRKHYYGLTQNQLKGKDLEVYCLLGNNGELEKVPRTFGSNHLAYREQYYPRVSRSELKRKNYALFCFLRRKDELTGFISSRRKVKKTALQLYNEGYLGVHRNELKLVNPYLVQRLSAEGDWDKVPADPPAYQNAWDEYQLDLQGLTRTELRDNHFRVYRQLHETGDIEKIQRAKPTLQRARDRTGITTDPLAFCRAKYPGITRERLMQTDITCYQQLSIKGDLDHIPRGRPFPFSPKRDDALTYYNHYCKNMTQEELLALKPKLYRTLESKGDLAKVPTAKSISTGPVLESCAS